MGYSQGILEAAEAGVVTATGVMANGPALDRWIDRLRGLPGISVGVHLNATLGERMTPATKAALKDPGGQLVKGRLAWSVLVGRLPVETPARGVACTQPPTAYSAACGRVH